MALYENESPTLNRARERKANWMALHQKWRSVRWTLGISSIVASSLTALNATAHPNWAAALSVFAATLTGLLTFVKPSERAKAYIDAWRRIDHVIGAYEAHDPKI